MNGIQEKGAPSDAEVLDQLAQAFAGDLAVEACIAESRAALDSPDLGLRLALAKKLAYACQTAPLEAPTPTIMSLSMATRTLQ